MAFCGVLFLLAALWDPLSASSNDFCVEQPEVLHVRTSESVIIPCTFSYPRERYPVVDVRVYWRAGNGDRCGSSKFIYNHTEEKTSPEYQGRITLVGDPRSRSGSIRINDLKKSDGDVCNGRQRQYCCRIQITPSNGTTKKWQNRHMTQLVFPGAEPKSHVEQLDAIPDQVGASVTIPCKFNYSSEFSSTRNFKVYWKAGYQDLCLDMNYIYNETENYMHRDYQGRVKLVSDPRGSGTSSLQIENVMMTDRKRYCCVVEIGNNNAWKQSSHGTELIVGDADPSQEFNVTQPYNIEAQYNESITISCNFTPPKNKDPLWVGVYWTVGEQWRTFVYHHNLESIDPKYRWRTQLIGNPEISSTVSLQVHNFTQNDSGTYYCLVAFRFCNGSIGSASVIEQGAGTRISGQQDYGNVYLMAILEIVALLLIVIIVVLILKKTGVICKGASKGENPTPSRAGVDVGRLSDTEKDPPRSDHFNGNQTQKAGPPIIKNATIWKGN